MTSRRALLITPVVLGVLFAIGIAPAHAQVKCYIKKCVEYPDGSSVCERTPVDCATVEMQ